MPDYDCSPIWELNKYDFFEPIVINDIEIQEDLKIEILEWDTLFQNTLDRKDGRNSGFSTNEDLDNFDKKGIEIWKKIIKQLPKDNIYYFSVKYYKLYKELKHYPRSV
ncbi:MAG: hypothetical protein LBN27_13425 [Prevotellaceae bacterium]|jgi:hypothetical protein|nr:hypothetical protein [Prevotellaceae bacterium]